MKRLILRHIDVEDHSTGRRAFVKLDFENETFEGRCPLTEETSVTRTVATAVLASVNEAIYSQIKTRIDFRLLHAQEICPPFLQRSLFIVIVDAEIGRLSFHLVGSVIADSQDWPRATASATLDAVNRLVHHILQLKDSI